ncbi:hypothetical protein [Scytonema sp. NUACC21]
MRSLRKTFRSTKFGATIATPIAGITDFTNNALDLGSKLGIELQLPSVP